MDTTKKIKYFIFTLLGFVLLLVFVASFYLIVISKNIDATTQKKYIYENSIHGDIKLSITDFNSYAKIEIYDSNGVFIENNITITLNGKKLDLSVVNNGFYGAYKYYYIGGLKHKKMFNDSDNFLFVLENKDKKIDLLQINKSDFLAKQKESITFDFNIKND